MFPAQMIRLVRPLLACGFVITSAFVTADIANTLARGALHTTPSIAMPRVVTKRALPPPAPVATPQVAADPAPSGPPPLTLIGTVSGPSRYAVILAPGAREQQLYTVGDDVGGGWRIARIEPTRVVLKSGDRTEVVEIQFTETRPRTAPPPVPSAAPGAGLRLDPREVEAALSDLNKVMTQARVVPHMVASNIEGYTIFDIVPGSVYAKLGLRNHDVIERVNGVDMTSPEKLYHLFQQLRNEKRIALDFRRHGKRETLNVEIR